MHASKIRLVILPILPCIKGSGVPLVVSPGLNISTTPGIAANLAGCNDLAGTIAPTIPCYNTLDVSSYLINYNLTSAEVCAPDELFSTCLLRAVYGVPGLNCVMVNATNPKCDPFDCASLESSTCPEPTNADAGSGAQAWYAVWNVYEVHQYVLSWATAVNVTSSQAAILGAVDPSVPNTSTAVMVTLINKYGLNPNADAALVKMLELPTKIPQPTYGNTRVRGESSTPSPAIWQALLVARLQDVLDVVMGNFTDFLGAVDNGTFSTRGLASASDLEAELKGASANVTASVSTHKSVRHHTPPFHHTHTPSASVSPYTSVTAYVTASLDTTYTDSSHIPASTVATVSARRPEGESTGPS